MAKQFYANGNTGVVAVAEAGADLSNPLNNLQNIYFHSALNYLYVTQVITGSFTVPQRDANGSDQSSAYGSTIYNISAHNLGYRPMILGYFSNNGQPIAGDCVLNAGGTASFRTITLGADSTYVYARELFLNKDVTFGAITLNYVIFVFNNAGL